jgi:FkbM family methyltransferase
MDIGRVRRAWKRLVWAPLRSRLYPEVETQIGDKRMRFDLRDHIISRTLYVYGAYEPELQRLMRSMKLHGAICLDIGANIGLHTIAMSELVGSSGKVYAFEPEEHNYRLLEHNLRINKINNVILSQSAVSDTEGVCRIGLNPINYGDHRISTAAPGEWATREVAMTTIDAALRDLPESVVRFIKIDVQGHELHVLRGMEQTLRRNPDAIMMIEIAPDLLSNAGTSATEVMSYLYDLGFTGWELEAHRIVPLSEAWVYDLIRDQMWVDAVVSRNAELLRNVMSDFCGAALPPVPPREKVTRAGFAPEK